jgi:hypothetical protein
MQMQVLQPAGQEMEDQEEISGHENRIDGELDHESTDRGGSFGFHGQKPADIIHSSPLASTMVAPDRRCQANILCARDVSSYLPFRF